MKKTLNTDRFDRLLSRLRDESPKQSRSDCPEDMLLAAYLDGTLSPSETDRLIAHFADCACCREVITAAATCGLDDDCQKSHVIRGDFEAELEAMEVEWGLCDPPVEGASRPVVMVVDDDPVYLGALSDTLAGEFIVTTCKNGAEALMRVSSDIRVIVLDIKMAGMSGLDVAETLNDRQIGVPFIFNTGYPGEFMREDIEKKYHPFGYATKDDPDRLLSYVRRAAA